MNSMTGIGYASGEDAGVHISLELKSVNSRYLDMAFTLPPGLAMFECRIRSILQEDFRRGRLGLTVHVQEVENTQSIRLNTGFIKEWKSVLEKLALLLGKEIEVTPDMILQQDGAFQIERAWEPKPCWPLLKSLLKSAEEQVLSDRKREGLRLAKDIECQLAAIETALEQIKQHAPNIKKEMEIMLRNRFQDIAGNSTDDSRILNEIAAWIIKSDINEEIIRLDSHISAFRHSSSGQDSHGKKLDFLSQEISREINTIGSKTQRADISYLVVDMKDAVEKIREQLRNVE